MKKVISVKLQEGTNGAFSHLRTSCVSCFLLLLFLLVSVMAQAEDYTWSDNGDGTCTITEYTGPGGDVVVPDTLGGFIVTAVGQSSFYSNDSLISATVPDSVTIIGNWAFAGCSNLTSVTTGDGVDTIGDWAFASCDGLAIINIGSSVSSIGTNTLFGCVSLTTIKVDLLNSAYSSIDGVLFNKNKTELIQYPGGKADTLYAIPDSVVSIGEQAVRDCEGLVSVSIPDSVISIGDKAFYSTERLISITFGSGVTYIGNEAFYFCLNLNAVYFKGNAPGFGSNVFSYSDDATAYYIPETAGWSATFSDLPTSVWSLAAADVDIDGHVNLTDFAVCAGEWLQDNCQETNNWCRGTDFDQSGDVGLFDLDVLAEYWLEDSIWIPSVADVDLDGEIDLYDFSVLGTQWGQAGCDASNDWCGWADFDRNSLVDLIDLSLLVDDWLYGVMP